MQLNMISNELHLLSCLIVTDIEIRITVKEVICLIRERTSPRYNLNMYMHTITSLQVTFSTRMNNILCYMSFPLSDAR